MASNDVCSCVLYLMSDAKYGFCKINSYLFFIETIQLFLCKMYIIVSISVMNNNVGLTELLNSCKGKDSPSACCPSWYDAHLQNIFDVVC